jgi:hypothetical protein
VANLLSKAHATSNCSCIVQTAIDNNSAMMKHTLFSLPLAALISASGVLHAGAVPIAPDASQNGALLQLAAADCSQVGQQVAQSQGGTLARATSQTQNGREVCVVVVLIPGKDGERPRRVEVAVPAN